MSHSFLRAISRETTNKTQMEIESDWKKEWGGREGQTLPLPCDYSHRRYFGLGGRLVTNTHACTSIDRDKCRLFRSRWSSARRPAPPRLVGRLARDGLNSRVVELSIYNRSRAFWSRDTRAERIALTASSHRRISWFRSNRAGPNRAEQGVMWSLVLDVYTIWKFKLLKMIFSYFSVNFKIDLQWLRGWFILF